MNVLVKEAGISKGSIFNYFQTKFNLYEAIIAFATSRAKEYLRVARDDTSTDDLLTRLRTLIKRGFVFIDRYPLLARIYFRHLHSPDSPLGSKSLRDLQAQSVKYLKGFLSDAQAAGEVRPDLNIKQAAFLLNGVMQQLLHAYYTEFLDSGLGLYQCDDEELEKWIDTTLMIFGEGLLSERNN